MITEKIDLYAWSGIGRKGEKGGYLCSYRHGDLSPEMGKGKVRPAILIIPGGAYAFVSLREGEPIALQYFAQGFDCFVLEYDIAPHRHYPAQILQAGMAMMYLRRSGQARHRRRAYRRRRIFGRRAPVRVHLAFVGRSRSAEGVRKGLRAHPPRCVHLFLRRRQQRRAHLARRVFR